MNGILLTWNPTKWSPPEDELAAMETLTPSKPPALGRWSIANHKNGIDADMPVFLLRQGTDRGIVASGRTQGTPFEDLHWDGSGRPTGYVEVMWDAWVPGEHRLTVERLVAEVTEVAWNNIMSSGLVIAPSVAAKVADLWAENLEDQGIDLASLPSELAGSERFVEGAAMRVEVNRYERDPHARRAAIEHHGAFCQVCGFDFAKSYGDLGSGFIEVHHVVPLSQVGSGYSVDPTSDLLPLCSNCHSMIHRENPPLSPEQLKDRLGSG